MELARKLSKAVQVFEGSDVAEDAEYGGGVEDDANRDAVQDREGKGRCADPMKVREERKTRNVSAST